LPWSDDEWQRHNHWSLLIKLFGSLLPSQ
jgi:hypothetical protein